MHHGAIDKIIEKTSQWGKLITHVKIDGIHGMQDNSIRFKFPFVVIAGENGTGKSTILKALSCAYKQDADLKNLCSPGRLFPKTIWDKDCSSEINYIIKTPQSEIKQIINKPSIRWRIDEKGRKRIRGTVFYLDVNRVKSIESIKGYMKILRSKKEIFSENLDEKMLENLKEVMDRKYINAKRVVTDADKNIDISILSLDEGIMSQFHMGTGEAITLELLTVISKLPNGSLVLIDEIESSLHPKAQRKIMRILLELCLQKRLQIILTTHSGYILEEVPKEFRVLLKRLSGDEIFSIEEPSTKLCLTSMDDKNHAEFILALEDKKSIVLLKSIIRRVKPSLLKRIDFIEVGSNRNVIFLDKLAKDKKIPFKLMGILDPDSDSRGILKLPGTYSPEREVILKIIENKVFSKIKDFTYFEEKEIEECMRRVSLIKNPHKWISELEKNWSLDEESIWNYLARIWAGDCMEKNFLEKFMKELEIGLNKP
jgi:predicted ATP-dependent endonuclease of OLD family